MKMSLGEAYNRLVRIKWLIDWPCRRSQDVLVEEYLRRSGLWAVKLNSVNQWPFWNIASSLEGGGSVDHDIILQIHNHLDKVKLSHNSIEVIQELTGTVHVPEIVKKTCIWYIEWVAIQDDHEIQVSGLPDPFEPLIRFYERGGVIIEVSDRWIGTLKGNFTNDVHYWPSHVPIRLDLDDATLDAFDAQYLDD